MATFASSPPIRGCDERPGVSYIRYSSYREALLARFATAIPMIITNWREIRDYDANWQTDIRYAIRDNEWPVG